MNLEELLKSPYGIYNMRKAHPQDQGWQDLLGPMEHKQMLQEITQKNPAFGTLIAAGVPFYTALKAAGVNLGGTGEMKTSAPSMDEIFGAWTGYGQGLADLLKKP